MSATLRSLPLATHAEARQFGPDLLRQAAAVVDPALTSWLSTGIWEQPASTVPLPSLRVGRFSASAPRTRRQLAGSTELFRIVNGAQLVALAGHEAGHVGQLGQTRSSHDREFAADAYAARHPQVDPEALISALEAIRDRRHELGFVMDYEQIPPSPHAHPPIDERAVRIRQLAGSTSPASEPYPVARVILDAHAVGRRDPVAAQALLRDALHDGSLARDPTRSLLVTAHEALTLAVSIEPPKASVLRRLADAACSYDPTAPQPNLSPIRAGLEQSVIERLRTARNVAADGNPQGASDLYESAVDVAEDPRLSGSPLADRALVELRFFTQGRRSHRTLEASDVPGLDFEG